MLQCAPVLISGMGGSEFLWREMSSMSNALLEASALSIRCASLFRSPLARDVLIIRGAPLSSDVNSSMLLRIASTSAIMKIEGHDSFGPNS